MSTFQKTWSNTIEWLSAVALTVAIAAVLAGAGRLAWLDARNIPLLVFLIADAVFLGVVIVRSMQLPASSQGRLFTEQAQEAILSKGSHARAERRG